MESTESILGKVKEIVAAKTGIEAERIALDADFRKDLQVNSMDIVKIVFEIEETYRIEVQNEEILQLTTVRDAVKFIAGKLGVGA